MNPRAILVAVALLAAVVGRVVYRATRAPEERATPAPSAAEELAREEAALRRSLEDKPNDPQVRLQFARVLRKSGRLAEAETELIRAVRAGLPDADGQREAALIYAGRDWPPQVEVLLQRVVRERPDDREVLLAVADSYSAKGRWLNAEPLYTKFLALEPTNAAVRFKRGVARMNEALYATAAEDFRAALAATPDDYLARLNLGNCLLGDAHMADAERELRWCHEQQPTAVEPLVGLATCAVERNDLAGAESLLAQAGGGESRSPLVLQGLAELYLRQQRTDLAVTTLRKLVALDPNHRQGHLQLAQALLSAGQLDEARRHEDIYKELDRKEEARLAHRRGMR